MPPLPYTGNSYWELRAFHHFVTATSATLPGSHIPAVRDCFAVQVPILALSHPPLWNEMVALGSLHLLSTARQGGKGEGCHRPNEPPLAGLQACRDAAFDAALRTYRPALSELGPHNADAAGFTAILLLIDTFATLREDRRSPPPPTGEEEEEDRQSHDDNNNADDNEDEGDDAYEPPMQWLRIVPGARAVLEAALALALAQASPARPPGGGNSDAERGTAKTTTTKNAPMHILTIIDSYPKIHYETARRTKGQEPPNPRADPANPLAHLLVSLPGEPEEPPEVTDAYVGAVQQLSLIRTAVAAETREGEEVGGPEKEEEEEEEKDDDGDGDGDENENVNEEELSRKRRRNRRLLFLCRGMMSFPCLAPPLFLDLAAGRVPRALAILAHFFALVARVRALWWVGATPAREVRAIRRALAPRYRRLLPPAPRQLSSQSLNVGRW